MNELKINEIINLYEKAEKIRRELRELGVESYEKEIIMKVDVFKELFPEVESYKNRDYYGDTSEIYSIKYNTLIFRAEEELNFGRAIISTM